MEGVESPECYNEIQKPSAYRVKVGTSPTGPTWKCHPGILPIDLSYTSMTSDDVRCLVNHLSYLG